MEYEISYKIHEISKLQNLSKTSYSPFSYPGSQRLSILLYWALNSSISLHLLSSIFTLLTISELISSILRKIELVPSCYTPCPWNSLPWIKSKYVSCCSPKYPHLHQFLMPFVIHFYSPYSLIKLNLQNQLKALLFCMY